MSKLLTEQELQKECLTRTALNAYGTTPSNLDSDQLGRIAFAAVDLFQFIQSQKLAHGEMVIGVHQECYIHGEAEYPEICPGCAAVDYESEQRERNK